ncbi:MAG: hypothetical protein ABIG95_05270 [Candidatus Woesearchaeota archaeon]
MLNNGRLQTAEHILAKVLEDKYNIKVGVCKFEPEQGSLEVYSDVDLREVSVVNLETQTNQVIAQNLEVSKTTIPRAEAEQMENLRNLRAVPKSIQQLRIVGIGNFDQRPCKDPHVANTKDIGKIQIREIKRVGRNRYRFLFSLRLQKI